MSSSQTSKSNELGVYIVISSLVMLFSSLGLALLLVRDRFSVWPPLGSPEPHVLFGHLQSIAWLALSGLAFFLTSKKQAKPYFTFFTLLILVLQGSFFYSNIVTHFNFNQNIFTSFFYSLTTVHTLFSWLILGTLLYTLHNKEFRFFKTVSKLIHFLSLFWLFYFYSLTIY